MQLAGSVRYTSLNAVTSTGPGVSNENFSPRYMHSMQVILTGGPATCIVTMEASFDGGATWGLIGTFSLAAGNVSGDIIRVEDISANRVRANLTTLTGGSAPTVTAIINSEPN